MNSLARTNAIDFNLVKKLPFFFSFTIYIYDMSKDLFFFQTYTQHAPVYDMNTPPGLSWQRDNNLTSIELSRARCHTKCTDAKYISAICLN